jgi:uncharacterized phage protein (TIGR01671 family)
MKREIKFRAFLKAESKMCDVMVINIGVGAFLIGAQPGADYLTSDGKSIVSAPLDGRFCNDGEFDLLQFTGLKDKNSKEIYEGDILRTVNFFDTDNKPVYLYHKVIYDTERAVFNAINLSNGNELLTTNGNCFLYVALKTPLIEIIGNIYENPELLKP